MAKNVNELDSIVTKSGATTKVLVPSVEFSIPKEQDPCPLIMQNVCRLEMALLVSGTGGTEVHTANIPVKDLRGIKLKTEIAVRELMLAPKGGVANSGNSDELAANPAFTTTLMLTAFKGKTPGAILLEDANQKEELLKGKKWLEANLAKYPANKKQVEAIDAAIALLEKGELKDKAVTPTTSSVLEIYKTDCKFKSKKDAQGNNLIYTIAITCDLSRNFPFELSIMNCYAPVVTGSNGQTTIKMSNAINTKKASIVMSETAWLSLIGQAWDTYKDFRSINAAQLFQRVASKSFHPTFKKEEIIEVDTEDEGLPY